MARALRFVVSAAALVVSLGLLWWTEAFGSCEGWKGTGTCPRDPMWDLEVFRLAFFAGFLPAVSIRFKPSRWMRSLAEAAAVGAAVGGLMVVITSV